MLLVCGGVFRSGSTWAFNVVRAVVERAEPGVPIWSGYVEGAELDTLVWRERDGHAVAKCHAPSEGFFAGLQAGRVDAVVFSERDPLTALASCVDQFCNREPFSREWTFERALERVEDGLRFRAQLLGWPQVLVIDLHRDGEAATLERIAAFLGAELPPADLAAVLDAYSFDAMRARSSDVAEAAPEDLLRGINDPQTLLHAGHVAQGNERDWRQQLSKEQVRAARERFAPYLHPGA